MNELMTIPFHGDQLMVAQEKSEIYVAVKPISDRLGLDWSSQVKRLQRHKILASTMVMMTTVAGDGKQREMLCLPLEMFHGWLVQIDLNRVNVQSQPIIERYQREAFKAIADHFSEKKDWRLKKSEASNRQHEMAYFQRYPVDRKIRDLALVGEPYWFIARIVGRAAGTVGNAIRRMLHWGVMDTAALTNARTGMTIWWRHRRKFANQLTLGF